MKRIRSNQLKAKRAAADVMTIEEAAARLSIGKNQAYAAVQAGKIPALRFGHRWLIPRVAFDKMVRGETA
jgi:excisionase family DNA binding protein